MMAIRSIGLVAYQLRKLIVVKRSKAATGSTGNLQLREEFDFPEEL